MKYLALVFGMLTMSALHPAFAAPPLGLPPVPIPKDNPQSPEKIALGDKLFHDTRFSSDGKVSCSTCHDSTKAFTDSPLSVSVGIDKLTGTRNAPTVVNAAYMESQFWDGREPNLEQQSAGPFVNPVEMGLHSHQPIVDLVNKDSEYQSLFAKAFDLKAGSITIEHVKQALASFERTVISGNSPFDRYYFGGEKDAMNEAQVRGLQVFLQDGRCVSCHTIAQTHALFSDSQFHNLGVGFGRINKDAPELSSAYRQAKDKGMDVDVEVLTNKNTSELGRFVVSTQWRDMGAFKTPTLRNVAKTAPYMHDGSLTTLKDVVNFYNNGGRVNPDDPVYDFQSGGIRPLNLNEQQIADLVAFLEALTSPEYQ